MDTNIMITEDDTKCAAVLWHGPGHQSKSICYIVGLHTTHRVKYWPQGAYKVEASWEGAEAYSGYFDEPPTVDE